MPSEPSASNERQEAKERISIEPQWAKLLDFETTIPSAVEEIVRRNRPESLPS